MRWSLVIGGGLTLAAAAGLPALLRIAHPGPWPILAVWSVAFVVAALAKRSGDGGRVWATAWAAAGVAVAASWLVQLVAGRPPLAALTSAVARGAVMLVALSLALVLQPRATRPPESEG